MASNNAKEKPQFTTRNKYEEYYQLFFRQSNAGVWLAQFDEPLPINLPIELQESHMLKYAYLAECNLAFIKMYGYDDPKFLEGARFPQLFDNAEASNLINLRSFLKEGYRVENTETIEIGNNGDRKYFLNDVVGIVEDEHLVRVWGMQKDITSDKSEAESGKQVLRKLTPEQLQILKLTVDGKTMKEIAAATGLSLKTVEFQRNRMRDDFEVKTIEQLIAMAVKLGIENF
jgi:DNA-binding CsgD family transcriptional regulator